jgi:Holliday junction resolvase
MRKFGSKDDIWNIDGERIHVPVDITAYKDGVYLIISCKYSIKGPTTYLDDPKRDNLIRYCRQYGPNCIPVMACVNEARHVYLINLLSYSTMGALRMSKRGPRGKKVDESQMTRLLTNAWATLEILQDEYKTAKETGDDIRRVAWASEIVKLINVINRLLKSAGETAGEDDITALIEQLGDDESG